LRQHVAHEPAAAGQLAEAREVVGQTGAAGEDLAQRDRRCRRARHLGDLVGNELRDGFVEARIAPSRKAMPTSIEHTLLVAELTACRSSARAPAK
jgi:hypothetical protein